MKRSAWHVFGYVNGSTQPKAVSLAYKTKKLAEFAMAHNMYSSCDKPFIAMAWEG